MKKILLLAALSASLIACNSPGSNNQESTPTPSTASVGSSSKEAVVIKDYGKEPLVINIEDYTIENETFRSSLWTGDLFQLTVMSIPVGSEIGSEMHDDIEQFLRIEKGEGEVFMGDAEDALTYSKKVGDDDIIIIPAGKWHNVKNTGDEPLKMYSIYATPEHPFGTVHKDKAESDAAHDEHHH